jgi:putative YphP/YqiW family bacilliredoxin
MYPDQLTTPMRVQLTAQGFTEFFSAEDVENGLKKQGTTLVVINSVCGCAAGTARPGVLASLGGDKKPDHLATVFAGVHKEAVDRVRQHTLPYPPSSPAVALFKDGELVHMVERHHIEGRSAEMIAGHLREVYAEHC